MNIKFGPAGLGSIRDAEETLEEYGKLGFKVCEIAFTYRVYIKKEKDAKRIRKVAKKFGIKLTIHAPYWVNLNSEDWEKVEASKKRILDSCKVGHWLGAERVVFHCGYFEKKDKEETYENIKNRIKEMLEEIKKNKWKIKLAPETMGKINVFGSVEEISRLVKDTSCSFCLDFAHILARDKKIEWKKIKKLFPQKNWHVHFSGIEYGEKGEKHHRKTKKEEWKHLLENLPRNKNITIINEAPNPVQDSFEGLMVWKRMKK